MNLGRRSLVMVISGAAIVLAGVATPATASPDGPIKGAALGKWDLPIGPHHDGHAAGALFTQNSNEPLYLFKAELSEHPSPGNKHRFGELKGVLVDPNTSELAFLVKGFWEGLGSAKEGHWDAKIFPVGGGAAVGKMGGQFTDPKPFMPGGDGKFKGVFAIEN